MAEINDQATNPQGVQLTPPDNSSYSGATIPPATPAPITRSHRAHSPACASCGNWRLRTPCGIWNDSCYTPRSRRLSKNGFSISSRWQRRPSLS